MCFSAGASFGAAAILTGVGVATVKQVQSRNEMFFAGIPMIFAVQQASEGFLWLSLQHPSYSPLQLPMTYLFLFFAQVVWPAWVPFSILKTEKQESQKRKLKILTVIGALVSLYLGYCLLNFRVEGVIRGYHIEYELNYPKHLAPVSGFFYVVSTIVPCLVSRTGRMWYLGAPVLISYIITTVFYTNYVVSVWCFFSSIISITVFLILYKLHHPGNTRPVNKAEIL